MTTDLVCQMRDGCKEAVTHIDNRGFVYCTSHGLVRRYTVPCRKLRPHELKRLHRNEPVKSY